MDGLSAAWPWNPGVLLFLVAFCLLYVLGLRLGLKRNTQDASLKTYHIACFFAAIIIMALVLLTPLDIIGRTQLFSAHMAQAIVLTTLCAPLVLLGSPARLLRPLVTQPIMRWLTHPVVASLIFNLVFLLWHAPKFFNAARANPVLYHIQLISIFLAALLNWWPLLGSVREVRRLSYPLQMLYAFCDGQPVDIFAFILLFTGVAIYSGYAIPPQLNLSAFSDQAVAGAMLLIPGIVDLLVMSPLFILWLRQIEQRTLQADQKRLEAALLEEEDEEEE